MKILAIEQSASRAAAALAQDAHVLAARAWSQDRRRTGDLFRILPALLREAGATLASVDLFAVGIGPGSFSGLRAAVAAASGMALPGRKPVLGIGSAPALALDLAGQTAATAIGVVGDARRGSFWAAAYRAAPEGLQEIAPPALADAAALQQLLRGCAVVATPHWDRIGNRLAQLVPDHATLIRGNRSPSAAAVARLAFIRAVAAPVGGMPLCVPVPLYLHAPTSARP